jgi:hypothetical protein
MDTTSAQAEHRPDGTMLAGPRRRLANMAGRPAGAAGVRRAPHLPVLHRRKAIPPAGADTELPEFRVGAGELTGRRNPVRGARTPPRPACLPRANPGAEGRLRARGGALEERRAALDAGREPRWRWDQGVSQAPPRFRA